MCRVCLQLSEASICPIQEKQPFLLPQNLYVFENNIVSNNKTLKLWPKPLPAVATATSPPVELVEPPSSLHPVIAPALDTSSAEHQQQQSNESKARTRSPSPAPAVEQCSFCTSGDVKPLRSLLRRLDAYAVTADLSIDREKVQETVMKGEKRYRHHFRSRRREMKCVRFADDLFTVRIITEPSDWPPELPSLALIRRRLYHRFHTGSADGVFGSSAEQAEAAGPTLKQPREEEEEVLLGHARVSQQPLHWMPIFSRPTANQPKFRQALGQRRVALENALVWPPTKLIGTIKVANHCFEKRVFVRWTDNSWRSHADHPAAYLNSPTEDWDTFRFELQLPKPSTWAHRFEFCVCFRHRSTEKEGSEEHWDAGPDGRNFVLLVVGSNSGSTAIISSERKSA